MSKKIGRYEICSKLGAGGMGEVYLANDTKLDRKVALKILHSEMVNDQTGDRVRRFVQEAKAASALNHPNILTIYEIDEIDAEHFIATEFVDGETLRDRIRSAPFEPGARCLCPASPEGFGSVAGKRRHSEYRGDRHRHRAGEPDLPDPGRLRPFHPRLDDSRAAGRLSVPDRSWSIRIFHRRHHLGLVLEKWRFLWCSA